MILSERSWMEKCIHILNLILFLIKTRSSSYIMDVYFSHTDQPKNVNYSYTISIHIVIFFYI